MSFQGETVLQEYSATIFESYIEQSNVISESCSPYVLSSV